VKLGATLKFICSLKILQPKNLQPKNLQPKVPVLVRSTSGKFQPWKHSETMQI